jgi:4'-phosphopantetheinyl transferase
VPLTTLLWLSDGAALDDDALAGHLDWLSAGELERHGAFTRLLRRRQFLVGRVMLRQAIGALLGVPARQVTLSEQPGAAPRLAWPERVDVGYSISHSGKWVACAVSLEAALGLDIEIMDPARDLEALAVQAFDPEEAAWLRARPEAARTEDFYALWCGKEARFKLPPAAAEGKSGAECVHLVQGELAVALCSSRPLAQPPVMTVHSPIEDQSIPKSK